MFGGPNTARNEAENGAFKENPNVHSKAHLVDAFRASEDFVGTPLAEWEEEFRRLGMPLPLRIKLRKLHVAGAVQVRSARPDPVEGSTMVSTNGIIIISAGHFFTRLRVDVMSYNIYNSLRFHNPIIYTFCKN